MASGYGASEMEIIRHAPARPLRGGVPALRIGAPRFHRRAGPWLDGLRLSLRQYTPLYVWLAVAGAALWPATVLGLAVLAPLPGSLSARPTEGEVLAWHAQGALAAGAVAGLAQWLAVRRYVPAAWPLVPATAFGWCGALALAGWGVTQLLRWLLVAFPERRFLFSNPLWERCLLLALVGLILGVTLGLAQALALQWRLRGARRWALAAATAWLLGSQFFPISPRLPGGAILAGRFTGGMERDLPALVVMGALYGLLTAAALAGMLRAAIPQPAET